MKWTRIGGIFLVCLGATGCATSIHRQDAGSLTARAGASTRTTAPRQVQVSLPPEQPDVFAAAAAVEPSKLDKYRLSRYFPGIGRPSAGSGTTEAPGQGIVARATVTPTDKVVAATATPRPSWFGFRKPKAAQTCVTDARPISGRSPAVEPSFLPVALRLPTNRSADKAVTPTSIDLPELGIGKTEEEPASARSSAIPSNPDASGAEAVPLSTTEPQLAVRPFDSGTTEPAAKPDPEPAPAPAPATVTPPPADEPSVATKPAEEPAADPRERPRLPTTIPSFVPGTAPAEVSPPAEAKPAEEAPKLAQAAPVARPTAPPVPASSTPSVVDPTNSLGLPRATVPASYSEHTSVAVRGSYQAPQPPPVLASPQVAATPQASVAPTAATKTWRRPCLRRLIRRMCNLGEFANPPTAKPH